jgi:hypothetical protein
MQPGSRGWTQEDWAQPAQEPGAQQACEDLEVEIPHSWEANLIISQQSETKKKKIHWQSGHTLVTFPATLSHKPS